LAPDLFTQFIGLAGQPVPGSFIAGFISEVVTLPAGEIFPGTVNHSAPPTTMRTNEPNTFAAIIAWGPVKRDPLFDSFGFLMGIL
jgi:hypothetical protein